MTARIIFAVASLAAMLAFGWPYLRRRKPMGEVIDLPLHRKRSA